MGLPKGEGVSKSLGDVLGGVRDVSWRLRWRQGVTDGLNVL